MVKRNERGISLMALVITIIVILILAGISTSMLLGENGILARAQEAKNATITAKRLEELKMLAMEEQFNSGINPVGNVDFVQPWIFNEYSTNEINEYVKIIKRAGYKGIIIQYIVEIEGGKDSSEVKAKSLWYNSNIITNTSDMQLYRPNVLNDLFNAVKENDMDIYIGLGISNDWWNNDFENANWRSKNASFLNNVIDEIETLYGSQECFKGWYWSFEMYTNNVKDNNNVYKYAKHWAEMINYNVDKINSLEGKANRRPIMVSPYISNLYKMTADEVKEHWTELVNRVHFNKGDIFNMQDGLGILDMDVGQIKQYIEATREAVKADENKKLKFWLNVENYNAVGKEISMSEYNRFIIQLKIASGYADNITTFSYSHYYNPKFPEGIELDKLYRKYYTGITGMKLNIIQKPTNGTIYEDDTGAEVPVPSGFSVSTNHNKVSNGLVITDNAGNEFVWIPVNGGVGTKGHEYTGNEYKTVYYARYLNNGVNINSVYTASLPSGVTNENHQIEKYGGFYVGRYESSYNYNNNNPTVKIKYDKNSVATTEFSWQYANSSIYTGYLWNNINSTDAKNLAEQMSKRYGYSSSVKTGLITGTQWDTMLKWIHSNDSTFLMITNGTTWGNYTDSVAPATNGNYESGMLKPSGSNANWQFNNIFDISGNLAEWTNEVDSTGRFVVRSNGYNDNGIYGSASYGFVAEPYQYPHVGFRVVLYID